MVSINEMSYNTCNTVSTQTVCKHSKRDKPDVTVKQKTASASSTSEVFVGTSTNKKFSTGRVVHTAVLVLLPIVLAILFEYWCKYR